MLLAVGVVIAKIAGSVGGRPWAAMGFNTPMAHVDLWDDVSDEARVAVITFAAMMALHQVGVGVQLIITVFGPIVGAVCLGLELAFGLAVAMWRR